jgi:hypothetical protein
VSVTSLSPLLVLRQQHPDLAHLDAKTAGDAVPSRAMMQAEEALRLELEKVPPFQRSEATQQWLDAHQKCIALRRCLHFGKLASDKLIEAKGRIHFPGVLYHISSLATDFGFGFIIDWLISEASTCMAQGLGLLRQAFPDLAERGGAVRNSLSLATDGSGWASPFTLPADWNRSSCLAYASEHLNDVIEELTDRLPKFQTALEKQLQSAAEAELQLRAE